MSADEAGPPQRSLPRLTTVEVLHLLEMGVTGPIRPVDRVIARLHQADAEDWLAHALIVAARLTGHEVGRLPEDRPTLEQLRTIKERAKEAAVAATSPGEILSATFAYLACVGAALAHHGRNISSRPPMELHHILVDLADAAPPRWRDMLLEAALRIDAADGEA